MDALLTIGYEGASIEDLIASLMTANVKVVIDVREIPISRKRGFSKSSLNKALTSAGLEYVHMRGLGDPKPGREAARRGDIAAFKKIFRAHMACLVFQEALAEATEIARRSKTCLLCFERDHAFCHRTIVADVIAKRADLKIRHLGVREGLAKRPEHDNAACGRELAFG